MTTKNALILFVLILGAGAAGFGIGRMDSTDSLPMDDMSDSRDMEMDSAPNREILYWQAPMNAEEIYDAPGKSAMGMDLIPVYAEAESRNEGSSVTIDPVISQNMGIRTERVEKIDFSRLIRTVGEVKYNEENIYEVSARISGWIEKLHVNYVGEEVETGDILMEIYSPELVSTQEELLLALENLDIARRNGRSEMIEDAEKLLNSSKARLRNWEIPDEAVEMLERSRQVQRTVALRSPASGVVDQKAAVEGAHVSAGTSLFRITDLSTVWVHASFYENEVPWIVAGQTAEMELSYIPGQTYTGTVAYVYPYLREKARDVHVRLVFSNPDLQLKPGMYTNVQLQGKVIPNALVVPTEAAIHSGERTVVFVSQGEGRFEPREIKIGEEGGPGNRYVRVISGLMENDEIVVSGQFMLDSESRLQEAIQKMLDVRNADSPESHEH